MKTLLIPTDFNIKTLSVIPNLVERYASEKLNILLVHMIKITGSMHELLMLSRRSSDYQLISDEFFHSCTRLKAQYENINSIKIEFFYGSTLAVFKSFLEAGNVDAIAVLDDYNYRLLNKDSIDPGILVSRSGLEIITVDSDTVRHRPEMVNSVQVLVN
jgi:hypothetical protein